MIKPQKFTMIVSATLYAKGKKAGLIKYNKYTEIKESIQNRILISKPFQEE